MSADTSGDKYKPQREVVDLTKGKKPFTTVTPYDPKRDDGNVANVVTSATRTRREERVKEVEKDRKKEKANFDLLHNPPQPK
jgi:hypothetical protein